MERIQSICHPNFLLTEALTTIVTGVILIYIINLEKLFYSTRIKLSGSSFSLKLSESLHITASKFELLTKV